MIGSHLVALRPFAGGPDWTFALRREMRVYLFSADQLGVKITLRLSRKGR